MNFGKDTFADFPVSQGDLPDPPSKIMQTIGNTLGRTGTGEVKYNLEGGQTQVESNASIVSETERRQRFGIECKGPFGDGITFHGGTWVPGGEYVQKLVVKNVSTKMKKLKYRLPSTRFFSLLYPIEIKLSPGTSQEFEVFFRPTRSEPYEDTIYFKMQEGASSGGFHVPVRAYISTLQCTVPRGLDMGLCPVNVTSPKTFLVTNTGEVPAPFEWKVPAPFTFTPSSGVVAVGEAIETVCTIHPSAAEVFVTNAVCRVGEGINATKPFPRLEMMVSAVAKYPHIVASEKSIDFGEVLVNSTDEFITKREIVLSNQSIVPAEFVVQRVEKDRDTVFTVIPASGCIGPGDEINVVMHYAPTVSGTYTEENFKIVTPGGNVEKLKLSGRCLQPCVSIYKKEDPFAKAEGIPNSINFRDATVGQTVSRVLFLRNDSELPAAWCVCAEDNGIFNFRQTRGIIPPMFEASTMLSFTPRLPGNFYRRVFILVENAAVQFVDLLGSGFINASGEIKEQRPAPIRHAHIQAYRNRVACGLGNMGPRELEELYEKEGMSKLFAAVGPQGTRALANPVPGEQAVRPVTRSGDATRNEVAVAMEFFTDFTDRRSEILIDSKEVDFGYSAAGSLNMVSKRVTMTNKCNEKISVNWFIPDGMHAGEVHEKDPSSREIGHYKANNDKDFEVRPPTADILPGMSATFQVYFKPSANNFYFCQELEALVFFKSQRSFRLVNDSTLQPPWNVTLKAIGHSFGMEQFLPKIAISKNSKLTFPSTFVGDCCYQTLKITNMGNLPAQFSFGKDKNDVYSVKPSGGLIPANDFQLVTVKFAPKKERTYNNFKLPCILNNTDSMTEVVNLCGEGTVPKLVCENVTKSGSLYLKPTCVGLTSERKLVIHNPTRVPLIYSIQIPAKLQGTILDCSPKFGKIMGNERCTITVSFAPRSEKIYRCKLHVKVRSLAGAAPDMRDSRQIGVAEGADIIQSIGVVLVCPGGGGAVSFSPPSVDFGVKLVNYSETKPISLINGSDCDIYYELLHHLKNGPPSVLPGEDLLSSWVPVKEKGEHELLVMDNPFGILPARSNLKSKITFQPNDHGKYNFQVLCNVARVDKNGERIMLPPDQLQLQNNNLIALSDAAVDGPDSFVLFAEEKKEEKESEATGGLSSSLPLQLSLVGQARFPFLVIRDCRVEGGGEGLGCSTDQLFGQMNLPELNTTLATPLTRSEVAFNMQSSPDLSTLPTYEIPFTPAVLESQAQVVYMDLHNPASTPENPTLPVTFSIHLPNEKTIEMETWADEGSPTEADIMQNRVIDELKCFEVYPKSGELAPGESLTLRLSYSYKSMDYDGIHSLPLLLRVFQGKQFWIKCTGRTLAPSTPCIMPRTKCGKTALAPVALGTPLHSAPLQQTELMNVGQTELEYVIDGSAIKKFNKVNGYGMEVLRLENPKGVIPPRSSAMLRWRFMPLEVGSVEVEIGLKAYGVMISNENNNQEDKNQRAKVKDVLRLSCVGYDPRSTDPYALPVPASSLGIQPPPRQLLPVNSQLATVSEDRLEFGRLPQRSEMTRLVVFKSNSPLPLEYAFEKPKWHQHLDDAELNACHGVVSIYPCRGRLEPFGEQLVKVKCNAGCYPRVLDDTVTISMKEVKGEQGRVVETAASRKSDRANQFKTKVGEKGHEAVVGQLTEARRHNLSSSQQFLPKGRSATLPVPYMIRDKSGDKKAPPAAKEGALMSSLHHSTSNLHSTSNSNSMITDVSTGLPSTGLRGTMVQTRGNKVRMAELLGAVPDRNYLFMHITGEIVEETPFFELFGGSLEKDGVRIPTGRSFVPNPMEVMPSMLVEAKDEFVESGSRGKFGGAKEAKAVKGLVTSMFTELVASNDVKLQIGELPKETRMPFLGEVQKKPPLLTSLQLAFDLFDVDASGTLSNKEVVEAFKLLGLSYRNSEVKEFLNTLDKDGDGEVDMKEFLTGLSPTMAKMISHQLEVNENMIIVLRAQRQQKLKDLASPPRSPREGFGGGGTMNRMASQQAISLGLVSTEELVKVEAEAEVEMEVEVEVAEVVDIEGTEEENAASKAIQGRFRVRKAKKVTQHKRLLNTAEGQEMDRAALMIQGKSRQRKAKRDLAKAKREKTAWKIKESIQDEDLRDSVPRVLNETIFNLLREAMENDFDINKQPRTFAKTME